MKEKNRDRILFVCGYYDERTIGKYIVSGHQRASISHQRALLKGFTRYSGISSVCIPFVGFYPGTYRKPSCNLYEVKFDGKVKLKKSKRTFFTLPIVRFISRFLSLFRYLISKRIGKEYGTILVYGAHTPFLLACTLFRKIFNRKIRLAVIITDLPEYMGQHSSQASLFRRFFKRLDTLLIRVIIRRFDRFIILSDYMYDRLGLVEKKYIVEEGVFDPASLSSNSGDKLDVNQLPIKIVEAIKRKSSKNRFTVIYAGGLSIRNGLVNLLEAFAYSLIDLDLIICGYGELESTVRKFSNEFDNINYIGFASQPELFYLYRHIDCFINPRADSFSDFTRYSFPSKMMEYIGFGKPVVCYKLKAMPNIYDSFIWYIDGDSPDAIASTIRNLLEEDDETLDKKLRLASDYLMKYKTSDSVASRIHDFLISNGDG